MKPMLASNYEEDKLKFPLLVQPKIDGVRGLNMFGRLTGRSLKSHANKYVTSCFSHSAFIGFDGEMAAQAMNHPDLCRLTTSALNTITGEPFILWHIFDYVTPLMKDRAYVDRWDALFEKYLIIKKEFPELANHLRPVGFQMVNNLEELNYWDNKYLDDGFEGTIIRDPYGKHKQGRSTVKEGGLLRIKRFIEEEAIVISFEEGQMNNNEAIINELGYTERSTHQENMIANGLVGRIIGKVIKTGEMITISPGRMSHGERKFYLENPGEGIGKTIKFQHFPKGVKDKPRFPTFQSFRASSDMGE